MNRIQFTSTFGGKFAAVFDGQVLEVFGAEKMAAPTSDRFLRGLMTITIDEPDRKGARLVTIYAGEGPGRRVPRSMLSIAAQDREVIEFFERVQAAVAAV